MTYRDDGLAMESRRQVLEEDHARLESELASLTAERQQLERKAHGQRWRLRGQRLLAWAGRHKFIVAMLLTAILSSPYSFFNDHAERVWQERQLQRMLERLGCHGYLRITSTPSGATILLDGTKVGVTPHRQRLCPGPHRIALDRRRCFGWQQLIQMPGSGELALDARLYSLSDHQRPPGAMVFSRPPGAIVFWDGREVGRTPMLVSRPGPATVAVARPGYRPVRVQRSTYRAHETLHFELAPEGATP